MAQAIEERARILENTVIVNRIFDSIAQGNLELLRQIVVNRLIEPLGLQAEQLVLRWSQTADLRDMDINRIKEGLDLLRDNQYPMHMVSLYENAPLESKPHQTGLYIIDKGLIDREGANLAFPELAPRMRNALTSHFETRNIRRNIPGAAAAATAIALAAPTG